MVPCSAGAQTAQSHYWWVYVQQVLHRVEPPSYTFGKHSAPLAWQIKYLGEKRKTQKGKHNNQLDSTMRSRKTHHLLTNHNDNEQNPTTNHETQRQIGHPISKTANNINSRENNNKSENTTKTRSCWKRLVHSVDKDRLWLGRCTVSLFNSKERGDSCYPTALIHTWLKLLWFWNDGLAVVSPVNTMDSLASFLVLSGLLILRSCTLLQAWEKRSMYKLFSLQFNVPYIYFVKGKNEYPRTVLFWSCRNDDLEGYFVISPLSIISWWMKLLIIGKIIKAGSRHAVTAGLIQMIVSWCSHTSGCHAWFGFP